MESGLIQFVSDGYSSDGMTSLQIATRIGRRHQHVMRDIRAILDQGVDASNFGLISYTDKANRQKPCYKLSPKGCLILASGYDAVLREKLVDMVDEYITKKKDEELAERIKQQSLISEKMQVVSWVAGFLNLNDASKLALAKETVEPFGISLPDYVPSKGVHHSATYLLKLHGAPINAHAFNELAVAGGYLEIKTRDSKKGLKSFYVITNKGLVYGENQVCPENMNETQPHWYDDRFCDLLRLLGIATQQDLFK